MFQENSDSCWKMLRSIAMKEVTKSWPSISDAGWYAEQSLREPTPPGRPSIYNTLIPTQLHLNKRIQKILKKDISLIKLFLYCSRYLGWRNSKLPKEFFERFNCMKSRTFFIRSRLRKHVSKGNGLRCIEKFIISLDEMARVRRVRKRLFTNVNCCRLSSGDGKWFLKKSKMWQNMLHVNQWRIGCCTGHLSSYYWNE